MAPSRLGFIPRVCVWTGVICGCAMSLKGFGENAQSAVSSLHADIGAFSILAAHAAEKTTEETASKNITDDSEDIEFPPFLPRSTNGHLFFDPAKGIPRIEAPVTRGLRLPGIRKALRVLYYNAHEDYWNEDRYKFYDYVKSTRFYFIGITPPGVDPPRDLQIGAKKLEAIMNAYIEVVDDMNLTHKDVMENIFGEDGLIFHFDRTLKEIIPSFEVYEQRRAERPPLSPVEFVDKLMSVADDMNAEEDALKKTQKEKKTAKDALKDVMSDEL